MAKIKTTKTKVGRGFAAQMKKAAESYRIMVERIDGRFLAHQMVRVVEEVRAAASKGKMAAHITFDFKYAEAKTEDQWILTRVVADRLNSMGFNAIPYTDAISVIWTDNDQ